jgi:hypothetical protein
MRIQPADAERQRAGGEGMTGSKAGSMSRRGFAVMGTAFALPIPPADALRFAIFRNGTRIGEQRLNFTRTGSALTVQSQVELRVRILSVTVFRYAMEVVEHWSAGAFVSADSRVNKDGTRMRVAVRRDAEGVTIGRTGKPSYRAPANALPFTHWNRAVMRGPIIDMETGTTDHPHVAELGWYALPTLPAGTVIARRYQLSGTLQLSDYYDRQGFWAGLEFHHHGDILYRKIV